MIGLEWEILGVAKDLILQYTLHGNLLLNLFALMSKLHSVWSRVQGEIVDAGIFNSCRSVYTL